MFLRLFAAGDLGSPAATRERRDQRQEQLSGNAAKGNPAPRYHLILTCSDVQTDCRISLPV